MVKVRMERTDIPFSDRAAVGLKWSLHSLAVDFLASFVANDADETSLVVLEVALICSVVHLDIILAIPVALFPPFSIGAIVIVEDNVISLLHILPLNRGAVGLNSYYILSSHRKDKYKQANKQAN